LRKRRRVGQGEVMVRAREWMRKRIYVFDVTAYKDLFLVDIEIGEQLGKKKKI